jgi:hypothetical protein
MLLQRCILNAQSFLWKCRDIKRNRLDPTGNSSLKSYIKVQSFHVRSIVLICASEDKSEDYRDSLHNLGLHAMAIRIAVDGRPLLPDLQSASLVRFNRWQSVDPVDRTVAWCCISICNLHICYNYLSILKWYISYICYISSVAPSCFWILLSCLDGLVWRCMMYHDVPYLHGQLAAILTWWQPRWIFGEPRTKL